MMATFREMSARSAINGAREAVRATVEADPWAALEELREAGKRKARADGVAVQMDKMRKVILSRISGELAQVHKNLSEAKLERMARADQRYETHVNGLCQAIEEKEAASADYWRIQAELTWMEKTLAHANAMSRLEK